LTPKATEILLALLDRRGRIVEKAELMRLVWLDTAVEDSNLTQNIYTLRKVLSAGNGKCSFIETIPRRGYRFVGAVQTKEVAPAEVAAAIRDVPEERESGAGVAEPAAIGSPVRPRRVRLLAVFGAVCLGAAAVWQISDRSRPIPSTPNPIVKRITNLGNVVRAAISRDGRSVVYAITTGSHESLWAKELDSADPVQLVEPAVGTFRRGGGLSTAPDGWVYYTWFRPDRAAVGIFRIHKDGGRAAPVEQVRDLPAFDPSGKHFACITTTSFPISESRLLVYDASGATPRTIARRAAPVTFLQMRPAWSPDGGRLAAWTMSEREPGVGELVIADVASGHQRVATKQRLHAVDGMAWLPDGSSVVVAARPAASAPLRLWLISLASGAMRPLTSDSDYLLAGVTEGNRLAAVRVDVARSLWVAPVADLSRARQVGSDAGELSELESLAWTTDGRLLYTSTESGNADIWLYDPLQDRRRQLTTSPRDDFNPASSPDGGPIVFASDRSGSNALWTMSDDGESSARQLTAAPGGDSRPSVAPDGQVVFQRGTIQSGPIELWRVPRQGGSAVRMAEGVNIRPAVSPNGRMVAYYWLTPERWTLAVGPMDGGQPLRVFPLSSTHCGRTVRWARDGQSLAYLDCEDGATNIWLHRLDGGPPKRLTNFRSGQITTFDWSRDGSQLAWITRNQVSDVVLIELHPTLVAASR
jgi:Tol biopolymer transport system component/DNA-binding winged helix-turn-helix (wHTH) protein